MRKFATVVSVLLAAGCAGDDDPIVQPPVTSPPVISPKLVGVWRAQELRGVPLPAVAERFEDAVSVTEFRLDSVALALTAAGRYTRTVAYSEWLNPDKTRPEVWELRLRGRYSDFGAAASTDSAFTLTSDWFQNLVVPGTVSADGSVRLRHGLTPGDSVLEMGFRRIQ